MATKPKLRTAEEHLAHLETRFAELVRTGGNEHEIAVTRRIIKAYRDNGIQPATPADETRDDSVTPEQTIREALEACGLRNRHDFRVNAYKGQRGSQRVKLGVRVAATSQQVERAIAQNASFIELVTDAAGFPFTVRVDWTRSGQPLTYVFHTIKPQEES